MSRRRLARLVAVGAVLGWTATTLIGGWAAAAAADDAGEDGRFRGKTGPGDVSIYGSGEAAGQGAPSYSYSSTALWARHPLCQDWFTEEFGTGGRNYRRWEHAIPNCVAGAAPPNLACPDGAAPLDPWWVGRRAGDIDVVWTLATGYQCAADILLALVEQAWDTMPIAPNTYTVQPSTGFAVADLGVVLAIDRNPRTMNTTLLGTPVIIRAIPTSYSWSGTDGSRWTSGAGASYEAGGSPHTFAPLEQRLSFTLTTTWRGEFSTDGGATWRDAPGTATTTSATTTLHVYHPHNHGMDCTLTGECASGGDPGGSTRQLLDPDGDGIENYLIPDSLIASYLTVRDGGAAWTDAGRKSDAEIAAQTDGR